MKLALTRAAPLLLAMIIVCTFGCSGGEHVGRSAGGLTSPNYYTIQSNMPGLNFPSDIDLGPYGTTACMVQYREGHATYWGSGFWVDQTDAEGNHSTDLWAHANASGIDQWVVEFECVPTSTWGPNAIVAAELQPYSYNFFSQGNPMLTGDGTGDNAVLDTGWPTASGMQPLLIGQSGGPLGVSSIYTDGNGHTILTAGTPSWPADGKAYYDSVQYMFISLSPKTCTSGCRTFPHVASCSVSAPLGVLNEHMTCGVDQSFTTTNSICGVMSLANEVGDGSHTAAYVDPSTGFPVLHASTVGTGSYPAATMTCIRFDT